MTIISCHSHCHKESLSATKFLNLFPMCESASLYGNFPEFMWTDKGLPFLKTQKCNLFWLRLHYSTLELHLVWPRKAFSSERLSVQTLTRATQYSTMHRLPRLKPSHRPDKNSDKKFWYILQVIWSCKMFHILQTIKGLCGTEKMYDIHGNPHKWIQLHHPNECSSWEP